MIIPDTNLLLYAVDASSPHHARARQWLDATMRGVEPVGFAWAVLLGFLRISTNARILERPLTIAEATQVIDLWIAQPVAGMVAPGDRHWTILQDLLHTAGRGGNLTTDAHLAALCIERGATLASADADFTRFHGLRFLNPLRQ